MSLNEPDSKVPLPERVPARSRKKRVIITGIILGLIGMTGIALYVSMHRVRSTAHEKILMGDARQISSAASQYFNETGKHTVKLSELVGPTRYISSLSSGVRVRAGAQTENLSESDSWPKSDLSKIVLSDNPADPGSIIALGHPLYDSSLSGSSLLKPGGSGGYDDNNYMNFDVATGQILKRSASHLKSTDENRAWQP